MIAHLPALQVVVPLIAAPLCIIFRWGALPWIVATLTSWIVFAIAIALALQVSDGGSISYALGGWLAPWGIEYLLDPLNTFMLLIVSGIASVALPVAYRSVSREIDSDRHYLFYSAFLLMLTGLFGMAVTGDAFNLFVFIEISSLSSYAMIAMGKDRRALRAAFTYLAMGTAGATFFLIGVGLLYGVTGTLNMADLADRIRPIADSRTVLVAFAFITVGLSLKLAMVPLHMWLPNAYTHAPSIVTAFLAATATKVAVYALIRMFFTVFGVDFSYGNLPLSEILLALGVVAVAGASVVAIFQTNLKRLLAYSSLAQIGYIILGLSFANVMGLTASLVHIFNHAATKGGLFLVAACLVYRLGGTDISSLNGIAKRMPWTMAGFVIAGLSLIGVPLTAGFVSKWTLVLGAVERGWWPVAVLVLATSLLAVAYIWKIVEAAYFQPLPTGNSSIKEAPMSMLIPTWVLIAATVYFGVESSLSLGLARDAAQFLFVTSP
jgi:multicomponent Na+:H+ antiporter subunit D